MERNEYHYYNVGSMHLQKLDGALLEGKAEIDYCPEKSRVFIESGDPIRVLIALKLKNPNTIFTRVNR